MALKFHLLLPLVLLGSCSPGSLSDYKAEEEGRCRTFLSLLKEIHDIKELHEKNADLKNQFEKIVDVILLARDYQIRHPDETVEPIDSALQEAIQEELLRLYALEGGREAIEKASHEALIRLGSHEKSLYY